MVEVTIMELIDSKTYVNLAKAFAGECQARTRYKFMEYGARNEGYVCLAEVIDKVVYNEFNHARMLYTFIQKASKSTIDNINYSVGTPFKQKWNLIENLEFSANDEREEIKIYKRNALVAEKEGFTEIAELFRGLAQIETCHAKLFTDLHEQMSTGTLYKKDKKVKWKCSACGHEATDYEAWKVCPVCNAKQGAVMLKLKNN